MRNEILAVIAGLLGGSAFAQNAQNTNSNNTNTITTTTTSNVSIVGSGGGQPPPSSQTVSTLHVYDGNRTPPEYQTNKTLTGNPSNTTISFPRANLRHR